MAEANEANSVNNVFQGMLSGGYVAREQNLLIFSDSPGINQVRRDLDKTISEVTEPGVFKYVPDEDSRRSMRVTALNAAKDFWTKKLEDLVLPSNAVTLGRSRITEITQRLEELVKPPETPK